MIVSEALRNVRHKTAMRRASLSRPVSASIRDRVLRSQRTFFDFGCGHGSDIEILKASGYQSHGWDPFYFSDRTKTAADVVNLGFVLNVIEDPTERLSFQSSAMPDLVKLQ